MTLNNGADSPLATINRLLEATNKHDLEALAECFSPGYVNETPAHPLRGFTGRDQVRSNWEQLFAAVPDIKARLLDHSVSGNRIWTEMTLTGNRRDGVMHDLTGVIVFEVDNDALISGARFFLEPVERHSGDINEAIARITHRVSHGRPAPVHEDQREPSNSSV
ncbi:nuclear transport factor 2 family protein [Arthrobacter sp. M4]|uniref:nuclear transport factor 2 family protein n=1 Tax=Arthrobacter sp. M4 TaxID=218160 RepID=UPI001CDB5F06|nr:nuclear transport factor 2 family protein [Arthrobacter sp. M4]MCA4134950.1 nuclear transport factor 2 family protein [Arthrobacter sp. M4]